MEAFLKQFCAFESNDPVILKFQLQAQKVLTANAVGKKEDATKYYSTSEEKYQRGNAIYQEFKTGVKISQLAKKYGTSYANVYQLIKFRESRSQTASSQDETRADQ